MKHFRTGIELKNLKFEALMQSLPVAYCMILDKSLKLSESQLYNGNRTSVCLLHELVVMFKWDKV